MAYLPCPCVRARCYARHRRRDIDTARSPAAGSLRSRWPRGPLPKFQQRRPSQRALRALLTGCPDWLRSLRGRPLGLVVFVRRDLVLNSIQQNTDQFLARHRADELRWNSTEALPLAAWVCERAGVLRLVEGEETRTASAALLS